MAHFDRLRRDRTRSPSRPVAVKSNLKSPSSTARALQETRTTRTRSRPRRPQHRAARPCETVARSVARHGCTRPRSCLRDADADQHNLPVLVCSCSGVRIPRMHRVRELQVLLVPSSCCARRRESSGRRHVDHPGGGSSAVFHFAAVRTGSWQRCTGSSARLRAARAAAACIACCRPSREDRSSAGLTRDAARFPRNRRAARFPGGRGRGRARRRRWEKPLNLRRRGGARRGGRLGGQRGGEASDTPRRSDAITAVRDGIELGPDRFGGQSAPDRLEGMFPAFCESAASARSSAAKRSGVSGNSSTGIDAVSADISAPSPVSIGMARPSSAGIGALSSAGGVGPLSPAGGVGVPSMRSRSRWSGACSVTPALAASCTRATKLRSTCTRSRATARGAVRARRGRGAACPEEETRGPTAPLSLTSSSANCVTRAAAARFGRGSSTRRERGRVVAELVRHARGMMYARPAAARTRRTRRGARQRARTRASIGVLTNLPPGLWYDLKPQRVRKAVGASTATMAFRRAQPARRARRAQRRSASSSPPSRSSRPRSRRVARPGGGGGARGRRRRRRTASGRRRRGRRRCRRAGARGLRSRCDATTARARARWLPRARPRPPPWPRPGLPRAAARGRSVSRSAAIGAELLEERRSSRCRRT